MVRPLTHSLSVAFILLSSFGCQRIVEKARPYQVYPQDKTYFTSVISHQNDSDGSVKLVNADYPIEVELFKDGHFRYLLNKLGEGEGNWTFKDGYLDLYAERDLFVMQMQIHSLDALQQDSIALEFSDRWGPQYLKLSTVKE